MKIKKIRNSKFKIIALLLITLIVLTNFISVTYAILKFSDEPVPSYLYEHPVTEDFYEFKAEGECYIIANVTNTDFSSFTIDGEQSYEVSYGYNAIPIHFSESLGIHNITLENYYFQSLTIEPLFLAEGDVNVEGWGGSETVTFDAGGLISILLKPNFSYNLLYVRLDDTELKTIYDTTNYPEIDSQLYSYFAHGGAYLRFDIEVLPKEYSLLLNGNGSIEYIIMVNDDWDDDALPDVTEVQKQIFYDLDPTVPDIWGFFEKSDGDVLLDMSETDIAREGYFSYYVPEDGTYLLRIEVDEGEYFDIEFDGDSMSLKGETLIGNTEHDKAIVWVYDSGWHHVKFKYLSNYNKIIFELKPSDGSYNTIKVIEQPELIDSDGDGVKDFEENNSNLKQQGTDSDDDGLPDNYDSSPFASLTLNKNKINRFLIPTDVQNSSIMTLRIKSPNIDYSTNGIPRLWRESLNVSIYPALRLFGNEYNLWGDSPILPMYQSTTTNLWAKGFNTYNLVDGYDTTANVVGDAFPKITEPNGETHFLFPNLADETWEFQFSFLKGNPAKSDGILDLRFDFIWLLTQYDPDEGKTKILHYYNFEEDIILQSMNLRETGTINYLLATPDNFVESQILWTLLQNPEIGTPDAFGVDDDVIDMGTVNYKNIANRIANRISEYYEANPNRNPEPEVSYFSGFSQNYDILTKYKTSLEPGVDLDSKKLEKTDFQTYYSYYTINNVYEDEDYFLGSSEIIGEYKTNYVITQNIYNENQQVATISELPLAMEKKNFANSDSYVLEITNAISEPIPLNEIPNTVATDMHPKINLMKTTYIEKILDEQIPTVHFDLVKDLEKTHIDNRATELDLGKLFFESDITSPSEAELFVTLIESLKFELSDLHESYGYFNTKEGQDICSAEIFNPYREFDYFLNNYIDENGEFLEGFLKQDVDSKIQELNNLEVEITDMLAEQRDVSIDIRVDSVPEAYTGDIMKRMKYLTKSADATEISTKLARRGVTAGKHFGSYATKGKYLGKYKGKMQYLSDRLENSRLINGGMALLQVYQASMDLVADFNELMKVWLEGPGSEDPYDVAMWVSQMAFGICNVLTDTFSLISGVIQFLECVKIIASDTLKNAKNFLTKATWVVAFVMIAIDWGVFLINLFSGEFAGNEIVYQFTKLVIETAAAVIGLAVAAAVSSTGYGILIGIGIALLTLLGSWLTQALNNPSIDLQTCSFYLNDATKRSFRRHGSLEVGDDINYHLKVKNDGDRPGWMRARFSLPGTSWDGWHSYGNWYAGWYEPPFLEGRTFNKHFKRTIQYPTVNLSYSFQLQFDWQRFELIIIVPTWWRTDGARESFTQAMDLPVLDNNIAAFYDDTTELMSTDFLKQEFEKAVENYRWKDAYDAATEIMSRTESEVKTSIDVFEYFYEHPTFEEHNANYFKYRAESITKFGEVIFWYYRLGFRAKNPVPDEVWEFIGGSLGPHSRHLLSFPWGLWILIPKAWINSALEGLGYWYDYKQKRAQLPIHTNIRTDLRDNPIDIDRLTKTANVNFKLYLERSDNLDNPYNPNVNYILTPPENFSITPNIFTQPLRSDISFIITQDNPSQLMGLYYFEMNITYNGKVIYSAVVPIRIKGFSQIDYVAHIPTEPIEPGDIFNLLDVVNLGTIPDSVIVGIEGVPENFIYKDLYPDEFFDNVQYFNTNPGESRETFVINPPRHYSTAPGIYDFIVAAIDPSEINYYYTDYLTCDGDDSPNDWWASLTNHYECLNEQNDSTSIRADADDDGVIEEFTMETEIFHQSGNISDLVFSFRGFKKTGTDDPILQVYLDGAWSDPHTMENIPIGAGAEAFTETITGLQGNQDDLDNLKVRIIAPAVIEGAEEVVLTRMRVRAKIQKDPTLDGNYFVYEGSFEIVVYHEIEFTCTNPNQLIYDYETATYNFEVTNYGNMDEDLTVIYGDLDFADSIISTENFIIPPGQTQSFYIEMDPYELSNGPQDFYVNVSNEFISSQIICSLEVIDDDTVNPYFENIFITDDCNWLNINFYGLDDLLGDDEGLSLIEIFVDGDPIHSHFPLPTDTIFNFTLVNEWIWELTEEYYSDGQITHEIRVNITDADNDRVGDELTAEFIRYFEVTLDEMYDYVIWLLNEVNEYIYDNGLVALYGTVTQKLVRVQNLLAEAYQLIEAGKLYTGLVRNKIAEAKLEIAEAKAELKSLKGQVGETYTSEILSMMHNIRNKIVELMGRSVRTEFAHKISLSEVDLYNLRDLIEENINETDRESLFNIIDLAASKLENAIFDIALDKGTEASIIQALHALNHANAEVLSLASKGKISETVRNTLLIEIASLHAQIYQLIDF